MPVLHTLLWSMLLPAGLCGWPLWQLDSRWSTNNSSNIKWTEINWTAWWKQRSSFILHLTEFAEIQRKQSWCHLPLWQLFLNMNLLCALRQQSYSSQQVWVHLHWPHPQWAPAHQVPQWWCSQPGGCSAVSRVWGQSQTGRGRCDGCLPAARARWTDDTRGRFQRWSTKINLFATRIYITIHWILMYIVLLRNCIPTNVLFLRKNHS